MISEDVQVEAMPDWEERTRPMLCRMPSHPDHVIVLRHWQATEPGIVHLEGRTRAELEPVHRVCQRCVRAVGACTCPAPELLPDPFWDSEDAA